MQASAPRSVRRLRTIASFVLPAAIGLSLGGCPDAHRNDAPLDLIQTNRIVNDRTLTPQQKREALANHGFSPSTINALLRDERLGNQYGGTLGTAFVKVVDGFFQELTPDEVQIYGDEATDEDSSVDATLSDARAQAIVTLFRDYSIDDAAELEAFLGDSGNAAAIPAGIPDGVLTRLFIDFDPERLRDRLP
jgi:hypothetical protein